MRPAFLFALVWLLSQSPVPGAAPPAGSPVDRALAQFDRDRDGRLTRQECPPPLRRAFDRLDRDGDGKLDRDELRAARPQLERLLAANKGRAGSRPGEIITPAAKGERRPDRLEVGDPAPDFTLADAAGKTKVTLSSFRGKRPVVLIFASYTWPPFRRQSGDLERLYKGYKDRAEFLLVYIREAHPDSVLFTQKGGKEVLEKIAQTETFDQRREAAQMCLATLKLSVPSVIDGDDNKVNEAYAGWPDRLYVVGADGRIAYKGGRGPQGFKPSEVEDWLKSHAKAR